MALKSSDRDWHDDLPAMNGELPTLVVPTLRTALAALDRRHGPMTRWQVVVVLLVDHDRAHRDLLDRLAAWPCLVHQRRAVDDPAERAQRREGHVRGAARRLLKKAVDRAAQAGE